MNALEFASLVSARLCHDLAGSVGAIGNGAELIEDEPDAEIRATFIGMIAASARAAGERLRFMRLAYGGGAGSPPVRAGEAAEALTGLFAGEGRIRVDWSAACAEVSRPRARLLLCLGQVAGDALTRGGAIALRGGAGEWAIEARGPETALAADERAAVLGEVVEPVPRLAPALLAAALARAEGLVLAVEAGATLRITVGPAPPR